MGKGSSKPLEQIDLSLSHPKFTSAKFIVHQKQRSMQTIMGVDNKEYEKWKDRVQKSGPAPTYLLLPIHEEFASKGLCGSSGTLTLDYQDFPYLLTEQISHRKGKKRLFQQNQLWYLLFALIAAKRDMKPAFSKIGDVRPQNIFINEGSQIKIANTFSWPHEPTNFVKAFDNEPTYLAPEEIEQLATGAVQSEKNDLSEMFSIGLTLLSASTLQDFSSYYDLKKHSINLQRINEKLNEFKLNRAYSDIFKGVVCNLCQFDQNKRVLPQQLYNWIVPHEQKIKSRQNFFIPTAPQKIHQEVTAVRQFISQFAQPNNQHIHQNIGGIRQSGFSGQKLNFPPPIIRTSTPDNHASLQPHVFTSFSNPLVHNAQSTYIPASKLNHGQTTFGVDQTQNKVNQTTINPTSQNNNAGSEVDSSKKDAFSSDKKP